MYSYVQKNANIKLSALLLSWCLVFSFGFHAVQISHDHANKNVSYTHEKTLDVKIQISEYMHHAEKKYLDVSMFGAVLLYFCISFYILLIKYHGAVQKRIAGLRALYKAIWRVGSFYIIFLRRGILHPKFF